MAKTIAEIAVATDTYGDLIDTLNEIANTITNEVVTANSVAGGAVTTGNTLFTGIFSANTIGVIDGLRGGNVTASAVLPITSNTSLGNSTVNVVTTFSSIGISNSTVNNNIDLTSIIIANSTASAVLNRNSLKLGTGSVNSVINSTAVTLSNSTVAFSITRPTAAEVAADSYWLNANGDWATISAAAGGNNTEIQFNDSGTGAGNNLFRFDKSTTQLDIGNSTVNVAVNSIAAVFGANLSVNAISIHVGNSTVNATVNSTGIFAGDLIANSTTVEIGSNLSINSTSLHVGNSTVNGTIDSTNVNVGAIFSNSTVLGTNFGFTNALSLTDNTSWAGSEYNNLYVDVNGSAFDIANPTSLIANSYYVIDIDYTTSHSLTFGDKILGVSAITPTATAGARDHFAFRSINTTAMGLIGYRLNYIA